MLRRQRKGSLHIQFFTTSIFILLGLAVFNAGVFGPNEGTHTIITIPRSSAPVDKFMYAFGPEHLNLPHAITHDALGNMYIIDSVNDRVKVFSWKGVLQTLWGETGSVDGEFDTPQGIAVDGSGWVYVADTGNHRIQVFNNDGDFKGKWNKTTGGSGSGDGEFNYPWALAINGSDAVYVADALNYRIQIFSSDGKFLNKWGSYGSGDGQFLGPVTLAINSTGHVYVADTYNNRIQVFDHTGKFLFKWGNLGSANGQFQMPSGVAINATNDLVFVADALNRRIQVFNQVGSFQYKWSIPGNISFNTFTAITILPLPLSVFILDTAYGSVIQYTLAGAIALSWFPTMYSPGYLSGPSSIAINDTGCLYISSSRSDRVQVFSPTGHFLFDWNGSLGGDFYGPTGVALNASGHVYVTDGYNNRIQVFDKVGNFLFMWNKSTGGPGTGDGEFSNPAGIAINASGHVFVADSGNNRIQVFDMSGHFLYKINKSDGGSGSGDGEFNYPWGITANASGHIYVTDSSNHRVQVFDNAGHFLYKFNKTSGGSGFGDGEFYNPMGITVNATGHVFVADTANSRIQVFDNSGHFVWKWGSLGRENGQFKGPTGIAINATGHVYVADVAYDKVHVFGNTAPLASNPGISPEKPTTADALMLDYIYSDIDGDPESGSLIRWYRNGTLQTRFNNLLRVSTEFLIENDEWYFTVQPCDGQALGDLVTSPIVTVTWINPFSPYIIVGFVVGAVAIVGVSLYVRRKRASR